MTTRLLLPTAIVALAARLYASGRHLHARN